MRLVERTIVHVQLEQILIGSVSEQGGKLVVACRTCGWMSVPVASGHLCGEQWDRHLRSVHGFELTSR